jgi:hypothetical protein
VGLRLTDAHSEQIGALEPGLRSAAEALDLGLRPQLAGLAPSLTRPRESDPPDAEALLASLDLDHEGPPDALSLAACLAAHRAYVGGRGSPEGVSAGALALARLLVWAQRAAMLGASPRIEWIGPAPRRPEGHDGALALSARCSLEMGGAVRRAEALALIARPETPSGS